MIIIQKFLMQLSERTKEIIDTMIGLIKLMMKMMNIYHGLMLKQEPKKPTTNNIKEFIQYVNKLKNSSSKN